MTNSGPGVKVYENVRREISHQYGKDLETKLQSNWRKGFFG